MLDFFAADGTIVFVFIVIGVVCFVVIVSKTKKENEALFQILNKFAVKYNGTVEKSGDLSRSRLKIVLEESEVEIFIRKEGGSRGGRVRYITVMKVALLFEMSCKIKIYPEHRVLGIGTVFGQDVKINNPEIDDAFVIQGTDEGAVFAILTPRVQENLSQLKSLNPTIKIAKKEMQIQIPCFLRQQDKYDLLIDTGLAMLKNIREKNYGR